MPAFPLFFPPGGGPGPTSASDDRGTLERTKRSYLKLGLVAAALLVAGFGGWAWFTEIASAVIAPGEVRAHENRYIVQHDRGGTVVRVFVKEGDLVEAGQPLLQLYDGDLRIERGMLLTRLLEAEAREARLAAEREGASEIAVSPGDPAAGPDPAVRNPFIEGQRRLFAIRKGLLDEMLGRIEGLTAGKREQIAAVREQIKAMTRQHEMVLEEVGRIEGLLAAGFSTASQVSIVVREAAHLAAEIAALRAVLAGHESELVSLDRQALQLVVERHEEASRLLRELDLYTEEVADNLRLVEQNIERMVVRAPVGGRVTGLSAPNPGAVVPLGSPVASIVPAGSELIIDAQVGMNFVDQVSVGQAVEVLMPAFSQAETPKILGQVSYVSADRFMVPSTVGTPQIPFYALQVVLDERSRDELRARGLELVSGMPVEIHVQTGMRSPFSYLVKPLTDQINRAFRED